MTLSSTYHTSLLHLLSLHPDLLLTSPSSPRAPGGMSGTCGWRWRPGTSGSPCCSSCPGLLSVPPPPPSGAGRGWTPSGHTRTGETNTFTFNRLAGASTQSNVHVTWDAYHWRAGRGWGIWLQDTYIFAADIGDPNQYLLDGSQNTVAAKLRCHNGY